MTTEERRQRIMQAAESLFGASGYAAVSMADIAQRCEMSKKTLYELFSSKEELLKAMIADVEAFPLSALASDDADRQKRCDPCRVRSRISFCPSDISMSVVP